MRVPRCAGSRASKAGHALATTLLFLAAPAVGDAPAGRGVEPCEYLAIYVDASIADPAARGREIAEPMRRALLGMAAAIFPELGLQRVDRSQEAYWTLTASSLVGPTSVGIFVELTGSIELQHHLYIAELGRYGFPYRGEVGGNLYFDILPSTAPERYRSEVERGVRALWRLESEQVAALCAMSAKLKEDDRIGMKQLRVELIEEIKRLRGARAERARQLELDVEDSLQSGDSN